MSYTPHTQDEIKQMLDTIGVANEDNVFDFIPQELKVKDFNVPDGLDEFTTFNSLKSLAAKNDTNKICFMGGGYYDHIIPSAVDALSSRSEFYTAYTPYQAEASQGTLQVLYEYQSIICELTGLDVSNASMYDGGTSLAESAMMAVRISGKDKVLIDASVNPQYIKIIQTYLSFRDIPCEVLDLDGDKSNFSYILDKIDNSTAALLFANPSFLGNVQDFTQVIDKLHSVKSLAVMSTYPIALGMIKDPGSLDVDIASADGQCLGNYLNFGGPSFGILATKQKYIRNLPGRIIGTTVDKNNKDMFVLTMQAREQHIRRHRATSNICTNQNLLALRATIFLSLLGKEGLKNIAKLNYNKAQYLKNELVQIKGIEISNTTPTFNEFIVKTPLQSKQFLNILYDKGFYAGIDLSQLYKDFEQSILVSVTEKRTKKELDSFVKAVKEIL